jgi:sodium-dependent dicarboxylate transporter 2/3/5
VVERPVGELGLSQGWTSAELRFESWRKAIGLIAGPFLLAAVWASPLALTSQAHHLAAIMALVVVWWITEAVPLPVTSLLGVGLAVVTGVATPTVAFAPFSNPIIFLFIGSFMIGRAIAVHQLDLRIAMSLLGSRLVAGHVTRVPLALGLLCVLTSGWVSGTATTAMMMPLAAGVLTAMRARGQEPGRAFSARLMLTIAFAASVGSKLTPVGAVSNMIALGFLESTGGVRIDFVMWMMIGMPMTVVMAAALVTVTARLLPHDRRADQEAVVRVSNESPGDHAESLTPGQRNCLIVFLGAAVLWITPGVVEVLSPSDSALARFTRERLDLGTVAILAAALLFILPAKSPNRRFTLDWKEASQIDWGTILLFGGGLSLGQLMFVTGLAESVGRSLITLSGADSLWTVTAMAVAAAIVVTQFASNTATAAMLTPVVLSICTAAGINPVPPALAVAFGCGVAFLLPISTPPNAIVYGTGLLPITSMLRVGAVMCVIGFVVIFGMLRVLLPLLGLA